MASAIHTIRTVQVGTHRGRGTNARTSAATLGTAMPISRMGHAAAAATSPDSQILAEPLVCPNNATTAHPNKVDKMLPSERETRLRTA